MVRVDDVKWLLTHDNQVHCNGYSSQYARAVAYSVGAWIDDLHVPGRQVGRVTEASPASVRLVVRLAVRCRHQNGQ